MSNQYLKLRRSGVPGKIPLTSSIDYGEIALNTYDGVAYMKKSGSNGEEVVGFNSGSFSGSFNGDLQGTASFSISSSFAPNIYNNDGVLTSNRTLTLGNNVLSIVGNNATSRFFSTGRLGLNTSIDRGFLIDVNGISIFRGTMYFNTGVANVIDITSGDFQRNITGIRNVKIGGLAQLDSIGTPLSGRRNTMYGWGAGDFITIGEDNVLLGASAGSVNLSGFNSTISVSQGNIIIGWASGHPISTLTNGQGAQPFLPDINDQFLVGTARGNLLYGNILTRQLVVNPDASTMPNIPSSAQFVINSTTRGFLLPRMTNAQRTGISSPEIGLQVYVTDSIEGQYLNLSSGWDKIITSRDSGSITWVSASVSQNSVSSSHALTSSYINPLNQDVVVIGNQTISGSLIVRDNFTVLGSASITYISESTLNIGTNLITVNTFDGPIRFGGLAVIDSGSSPLVSASFLYDSLQDEFIFVHKGIAGGAITSSHFIVGPETYNDLGNEIYLTENKLPKSAGNEHLNDSNISDDGNIVSINSNTQITGSLIVSGVTEGSGSSHVLMYNTSSGELFYTASSAIGGGGNASNDNFQQIFLLMGG